MADDSFKSFVLDQLTALPELRARAMFGGHGLYSGERFFGILFEGRVYFKADEVTRAAYESRGMSAFTYEMKGRVMTMSYYEVPLDVLEDRAITKQRSSTPIHATGAARKSSDALCGRSDIVWWNGRSPAQRATPPIWNSTITKPTRWRQRILSANNPRSLPNSARC